MYNLDELQKKWQPVIEHQDLPKIEDAHRRSVMATILENQEISARESMQGSGGIVMPSLLGEAAPTNAMGASSSTASAGAIDMIDPVLISLVRRSMPNLMAYDVAGVQPMQGPVGLIFAMRSRYSSQTGSEAMFDEANTSFSAHASGNTANQFGVANGAVGTVHTGTDPNDRASGSGYTVQTGMTTALSEALGDSATNRFNEMAFSIEKISVTAVSRALRADYTIELAQDLLKVHGLNAETELSNILSTEILNELNREVIRTINYSAVPGATKNVGVSGTFNLDTDANGRWSVEKFKGLMIAIDRDASAISRATRRGKGNILICSSDIAAALNMAGVLDYTPALNNNLQTDDTGNTFAGVLNGKMKVYIDPYFADATNDYYTVGYKGSSAFDAGLFYCPYVPLQMLKAQGEHTFQPKIAFKTRYGMVANPFATNDANGIAARLGSGDGNKYYRLAKVTNLM
jgi:hypothetical protein